MVKQATESLLEETQKVIKSDPDPDMPKPDMPGGNYSTKQGNLLIIYKQEQEGGVRDEE